MGLASVKPGDIWAYREPSKRTWRLRILSVDSDYVYAQRADSQSPRERRYLRRRFESFGGATYRLVLRLPDSRRGWGHL